MVPEPWQMDVGENEREEVGTEVITVDSVDEQLLFSPEAPVWFNVYVTWKVPVGWPTLGLKVPVDVTNPAVGEEKVPPAGVAVRVELGLFEQKFAGRLKETDGKSMRSMVDCTAVPPVGVADKVMVTVVIEDGDDVEIPTLEVVMLVNETFVALDAVHEYV
jgi:hypothetical protein